MCPHVPMVIPATALGMSATALGMSYEITASADLNGTACSVRIADRAASEASRMHSAGVPGTEPGPNC